MKNEKEQTKMNKENKKANEDKSQFRNMREVQWDRWSSNSSGSHSSVHVTFDGKRTLCNKNIPQVVGLNNSSIQGEEPLNLENFSKLRKGKSINSSGWGSSESGRTYYDLFVDYSSTTLGLYYPEHAQSGTCECCAKRSRGKFIKNHRTFSRERDQKGVA